MKAFALAISLCFISIQISIAQELISSYHSKNQTEKIILNKIQELPEVKEWFKTTRKSEPDIMINLPDSTRKYYWFQVGLSNLDMFRTSYHLFVDPKTYKIYFLDFLDESGGKLIPLKQWRYWRLKPEFNKPHKWANGELIVLKK